MKIHRTVYETKIITNTFAVGSKCKTENETTNNGNTKMEKEKIPLKYLSGMKLTIVCTVYIMGVKITKW